jgi:hypothetical protein
MVTIKAYSVFEMKNNGKRWQQHRYLGKVCTNIFLPKKDLSMLRSNIAAGYNDIIPRENKIAINFVYYEI